METAHRIPLEEAIDMTSRYRSGKETILAEDFRGKNILPLAETFDRAAFDALLAQEGCASLRIYYGMKEDSSVHLIIVGADGEGADILPADAVIIEEGKRCPPDCGVASPLNS